MPKLECDFTMRRLGHKGIRTSRWDWRKGLQKSQHVWTYVSREGSNLRETDFGSSVIPWKKTRLSSRCLQQ